MKYIATATTDEFAASLREKIESAGGTVLRQSPAMPEIIIFDGGDRPDEFWVYQFTHPGLKSITRDQKVNFISEFDPIETPIETPLVNATAAGNWHLDAINAGPISEGIPQSPVNVYVIDTGIASHPDLPGNIGYLGEMHATGGNTDRNGHGTHVAGLVTSRQHGVTMPNEYIRLYSAQVLDENGSGSMTTMVDGMLACLEHHVQQAYPSVVNMSLSARGQIGSMPALAVLRKMQDAGMMIVAAAGNRGESLDHHGELPNWEAGIDTFPAEVPGVLCVSAAFIDDLGKYGLATFSNYGGNARINAPGQEVTSTYLNSQHATINGTSMASPLVAGALALRMTGAGNPPTNAQEAAHYIDSFVTAFNSPSVIVSDHKMHTRDFLDLSFIRKPELWNTPDAVPSPPKDEPWIDDPPYLEPPKDYSKPIMFAAVVVGLAVLAWVLA